jgi:hypothetical protein
MRSVEDRPLYVFSACLVAEIEGSRTLTATLCVEGPDVVVDDTRWLLIDVFVEDLPAEERYIILSIHGPVE